MTATHSDAAAFLAAIRAAKDDDAPRLIYADWLDERGEAERAEFIRVQCELASSRHGGIPKDRFASLRRRERELMKLIDEWVEVPGFTWRNEKRSFGVYPDNSPIYLFSRGFISHVTCRMEGWIGRMCERCGGTREDQTRLNYEGPPVLGMPQYGVCRMCHGSGVTGRHGPKIVRAESACVERVTFSDKRPNRSISNGWAWSSASGYNREESPHHQHYDIPHEIWATIQGPSLGYWKYFDSELAALDALSDAAIAFASLPANG